MLSFSEMSALTFLINISIYFLTVIYIFLNLASILFFKIIIIKIPLPHPINYLL